MGGQPDVSLGIRINTMWKRLRPDKEKPNNNVAAGRPLPALCLRQALRMSQQRTALPEGAGGYAEDTHLGCRRRQASADRDGGSGARPLEGKGRANRRSVPHREGSLNATTVNPSRLG